LLVVLVPILVLSVLASVPVAVGAGEVGLTFDYPRSVKRGQTFSVTATGILTVNMNSFPSPTVWLEVVSYSSQFYPVGTTKVKFAWSSYGGGKWVGTATLQFKVKTDANLGNGSIKTKIWTSWDPLGILKSKYRQDTFTINVRKT
jgi:hypothetical protein